MHVSRLCWILYYFKPFCDSVTAIKFLITFAVNSANNTAVKCICTGIYLYLHAMHVNVHSWLWNRPRKRIQIYSECVLSMFVFDFIAIRKFYGQRIIVAISFVDSINWTRRSKEPTLSPCFFLLSVLLLFIFSVAVERVSTTIEAHVFHGN